MNRPSIVAACCLLTAAHIAIAGNVSLPYSTSDNNGNQWMVFFQGNLQQQGNQPIFSQAGMVTINGQQPQANNQTASFDEKNSELTLNFVQRGSFRHTRRIKFDDSGIVRILDIFENAQNQDTTLNVSLMTNTNFGVSDSSLLSDPKKKANNIGWIAMTGANRCAMSLFAGKGSKVTPTMRAQPNGNGTFAMFPLKLPAKGTAAIVHWHGTFDTMDAATQWVDQLRESKMIADLPPDLRKAIVNLNPASDGAVAGRELLRGTTNDVIELRGGDQMRGDLKLDAYTLDTADGPVTLPASKIAGVLSVGDYRPHQLVVTADGEIFGGSLKQASIPILLSSGQSTQIPLEQISRIGYRTNGVEPAPWKFDRPMVFLIGGERCLIETPTDPVDFVTRYGPLHLAPSQIAAVLFTNTADAYTLYLTDGSRLSGVFSQSAWPLKLLSTTAEKPIDFALASLARVQFKPLDDTVGTGAPTVGLLGDDIVAARIEGALKLLTPFDTLTLDGPEIQSITRPNPGQADLQVTLFDGSTFRGTLDVPSLTVTLVGDTKLTFPVAALRDYQNPRPFPSPSVVKQVQAAIDQLNQDDFKVREQAEAQIVALGPTVASVLEDAAPKQPPEARERLLSILKRMKKDQPLPPTRLAPPPPME